MTEHKQFNLPSQADQRAQDATKVPQQDFVSSPNVVRTDKTLIVKDFLIANDTELQMLRGQKFKRFAVESSTGNSVFTVATTEYLIGITKLADAPSVGLPQPSLAGVGKTFIIKDEVGGAGTTTITVRVVGEANIDGASSDTITANYGFVQYYSDGANWFTL